MAYVYLVVVDGVVRYVGQGSGKGVHSRFSDHMRNVRGLLRHRAEGLPIPERLYRTIAIPLAHEWLDGAIIEERIVADDLSKAEALKLELQEIISHGGYDKLWNKKPRGGDRTGHKQSAETRAKRSVTMAGRALSPEHCEALKKPKNLTHEQRKAMSERYRERMMKLSPEERKRRATVASAAAHGTNVVKLEKGDKL
jgi:hypothetical protein